MFDKKKSPPQKRIDSLIGAGTTVHGDVTFSGGLRIDGVVHGKVRVSHVVINGAVSGPVTANDYLELQAKARVNGDVEYRRLEMHVGAIVQGKLVHSEPESASVVELKRATGE